MITAVDVKLLAFRSMGEAPVEYTAELDLPFVPFGIDLEHDMEALEVVFRQLNHVDGTEWISQENRRYRSLSVGDQVTIGPVSWLVGGLGWTKVRL